MKIIAFKENISAETRVAITPETTKLFINDKHLIYIQKDAGLSSGFTNEEYTEAGANITTDLKDIISEIDIALTVQAKELKELSLLKKGSIVIGMFSTFSNHKLLQNLADKKIDVLDMEKIPRITKTQIMDVLSSQSTLAGYRAVIEAVYNFSKGLSMMMTAAGTLAPAKVLILGVGVAGLSAIATAKRLGAIVFASDIRKATKEQVESLGGKFLSPKNISDMEDVAGYAKVISKEEQQVYKEFLQDKVKEFDIIITTAQVPGKAAPILLTKNMVQSLKHGSIIVDMSVSSGGNVEGSKVDEIVEVNGVKIIGYSNLASRIPYDSSKLYAKNLYNFIKYTLQNDQFNFEDEVTKQLIVVKNGELI